MKTIIEKSQAIAPDLGDVASGKAVSKPTLRSWLKSRIVTAALWGYLPFALADWLIQRGGLSHD
jgi:hypothetical protein